MINLMVFMVMGGMVFCAIISNIFRARSPKEAGLTLSFAAADPVVLHVHGFGLVSNDGVVGYTHGSIVTTLDGGFRLRPTHFDECISQRNHGLGTDE